MGWVKERIPGINRARKEKMRCQQSESCLPFSYLSCVSNLLLYSIISWHRPESSDNFFSFFLSFSSTISTTIAFERYSSASQMLFLQKEVFRIWILLCVPAIKRAFMERNWTNWGYKPQKKQCILIRKIGWQMYTWRQKYWIAKFYIYYSPWFEPPYLWWWCKCKYQ